MEADGPGGMGIDCGIDGRAWLARAGLAAVALLLAGQLAGFAELFRHPVTGPDYLAASEFVAERHRPGEPILVALPPPAYLALGTRDDLVFVSSPLESARARRYTRRLDDGRYVDYWLGVDAIVSTEQLCAAFAAEPALWLIVDDERLGEDWAFRGPMGQAMVGMTTEAYHGTGGVSVRRLAPPAERDPAAEEICAQAGA